MYQPPCCPNHECPAHAPGFTHPTGAFYAKRGFYSPKCRPERVPRFRCKVCQRGFSRQTFRQDYRDHKPHLNEPLWRLLLQGRGLRQSGRILKLSRRCTQLKARKISRHLAQVADVDHVEVLVPWRGHGRRASKVD